MLRDQYPRAYQRLQDAAAAHSAAIEVWNRALDEDLFTVQVYVDGNGAGTVSVFADWGSSQREVMTSHLREFTAALWDALDQLVQETVEMFAVQHAIRDPTAPRFFPMADDPDSFKALLATSCLNGVLRPHLSVIAACQPFSTADDPVSRHLRNSLARLLAWTQQLDDGAQISAWAAPESPAIVATKPAAVASVQICLPAEVTDDGLAVARFLITGHEPWMRHLAQANTYIDPYMPGDTAPEGDKDHFPSRARACKRAVLQIVAQFAALSQQVTGARNLLPPAPAAPDEPPSGRFMTKEEAAALRSSESKVAMVVDRAGTRSIVVATPNGIMQRDVLLSSPLRAYKRVGDAAETAVRDAVATWGLPDFAMRPRVERKGAGVREIGDGIVYAGDRGIILQVKRREEPSGNRAKEERWVDKQIAKACRQVDGSHRRLSGDSTQLVNGRGVEVTIDTTRMQFIGVVIIDHPDDGLNSPIRPPTTRTPTVVLSRRDWEFLFNQLRSTRAVADYLFRVGVSTNRLHDEPARYFEHAVLDAAAPAAALSALHVDLGRSRSVPQLPLDPVGADDPAAHGVFRLISEDIAEMPPGDATLVEIIEVLAMLDGLHVTHRSGLGRLLLDALAKPSSGDARAWQFRTFLPTTAGAPQLAFGTCTRFDEITQYGFRSWIELRHQERAEREDLTDAATVGILLTPRHDGYREWDTTLTAIRGDLRLTRATLARYRRLWGRRGTAGNAA